MVGHTHDYINVSFGHLSMKLHEEDFPTIPLLMKSYMDLDYVPVILHMMGEVPYFKTFIKSYMLMWCTVWLDIPKLNYSASMFGMMVPLPCN